MRILEDWLSFLSTAYEPVQLTFDARRRKNRTEKFRLSPHDTEMEVELTIATIFFTLSSQNYAGFAGGQVLRCDNDGWDIR
jgi:hypothetical protein